MPPSSSAGTQASSALSATAPRAACQVTPTDAEISAHFDKNKETYRIPDRRRIKFVRVNPAELALKIKVSKEDVERRLRGLVPADAPSRVLVPPEPLRE